jgi:hypothetical protein
VPVVLDEPVGQQDVRDRRARLGPGRQRGERVPQVGVGGATLGDPQVDPWRPLARGAVGSRRPADGLDQPVVEIDREARVGRDGADRQPDQAVVRVGPAGKRLGADDRAVQGGDRRRVAGLIRPTRGSGRHSASARRC